MNVLRAIAGVGVLCLATCQCYAGVITEWNFNSPVPDNNTATGTLDPSVGAGVATVVGGVTGSFASGAASGGSSDPAETDNSGWQTTNYAAPGTEDRLRGVQFQVSTAGFQNILISWDQRHSNTASKYVQFQYATDGSTFVDFGNVFEADAGDAWFNGRTVDLSTISEVNDNPTFAFRVVAAMGPTGAFAASNPASNYASTGTWRFDMVTVNGGVVPEPGTIAMFGIGLVSVVGYSLSRRRGKS